MQQTLRVLPNPYTFIDRDGEAMGACPPDPEHSNGRRMWIGASLDKKRTVVHDTDDRGRKIRRPRGDSRPFKQTTKFVFEKEPIEIPQTPHYLDRIRGGDLIAADVDTYRKAMGNDKGFLSPDKALDVERKAAISNYEAAYGHKPAFAQAAETPKKAPAGGIQ